MAYYCVCTLNGMKTLLKMTHKNQLILMKSSRCFEIWWR